MPTPDSTPALLIIDMQNSFCRVQGAFAKLGVRSDPTTITPRINDLRTAFRTAKLPVYFIYTVYNTDYSNRRPRDPGDSLEKLHGLVRESWDAAMLDDLTPVADELVLEKTRRSAFVGTSLEQALKDRGVNQVILTGVGTDVCVESTARGAFDLDLEVVVVSDATGTCDEKDHAAALHALRTFGAIVSTANVIRSLSKREKSD